MTLDTIIAAIKAERAKPKSLTRDTYIRILLWQAHYARANAVAQTFWGKR